MSNKFFTFAIVSIFLASCTHELTGISLNKATVELRKGATLQLVVQYQPKNAEDAAPEVTWKSSDEAVAKVDNKN